MLGNVRTLLGWAVELLIKMFDWVTGDEWMDTPYTGLTTRALVMLKMTDSK